MNEINHDIVDFCKIIADSAPEIPFYYYHIPSVTGLNFSMTEMINFSKTKIQNFAGIKFTHNNKIIKIKDPINNFDYDKNLNIDKNSEQKRDISYIFDDFSF